MLAVLTVTLALNGGTQVAENRCEAALRARAQRVDTAIGSLATLPTLGERRLHCLQLVQVALREVDLVEKVREVLPHARDEVVKDAHAVGAAGEQSIDDVRADEIDAAADEDDSACLSAASWTRIEGSVSDVVRRPSCSQADRQPGESGRRRPAGVARES